jgi:arylsulfatase A-like enzyme
VPVRTGLTKVGIPGTPEGWQKTDVTMATAMKSLDYMTGQFGKNHQGECDEHLPTRAIAFEVAWNNCCVVFGLVK